MRLGDVNPATAPAEVPWYTALVNSVATLGGTYLTLKQQNDFAKIQTQRAQQGLPPLAIGDYAAQLQVGLGSSTQNTLIMIAAGGIGAYLLLGLMKKRR